MTRRLLFLAVVCLVPALSRAEVPGPAADVAARLDDLYAHRDEAGAIKEAEAVLTEALKATPGDYAVLWRAARYRYWQADGAPDDRLKKQLGKESWDLGDRAVKANPAGPEGYYYAAIGMGGYSQAVGILRALSDGIEGKFNERLDKSIAMNDSMNFGGPRVAKGRYHYELPWPKRDLGKAKEQLGKVLARYPQNLRAHLYLAQVLLKDGDAKGAKVEVDKVLAGSTDYDPPEGRRIKVLAPGVAKQIAEALE